MRQLADPSIAFFFAKDACEQRKSQNLIRDEVTPAFSAKIYLLHLNNQRNSIQLVQVHYIASTVIFET